MIQGGNVDWFFIFIIILIIISLIILGIEIYKLVFDSCYKDPLKYASKQRGVECFCPIWKYDLGK